MPRVNGACGILGFVIAEVIATYGRHLLLQDDAGARHRARPLGRKLEIICGDQVECEFQGAELLATRVLPRSRLLRRTNLRGRSEPLAANLTQLGIVLAAVPAPDLFIVDRYLSAAASASLSAIIVLNKADLPGAAELRASLAAHAALGYRVLEVAAIDARGLAPLRDALAGHTTILAGQSGVGKSSLTRLLTIEDADIEVGALVRDEEGRHTTTASRMYPCQGGGRIIDSPGVRDFAPALDDLEPASLGFIEVAQRATGCRFLDCRHMHEPDCAVRGAVDDGSMDARRYESYRRLRRLFDQLWEQRTERERASRPR